MRLEASATAMYAGMFRKRTAADGTGEAEAEQYGDFALVENVLRSKGLQPDFETDALLRYTHRRNGETEIYFVANPEEREVTAACIFRVGGKQPELWDPVEGTSRRLPEFVDVHGRTSVILRLEPHQSIFVVFSKIPGKKQPAGSNFPRVRKALELGGPWEVTFDTAWGGPGTMTFQHLDDWSNRKENQVKFFSGVATYKKVFDLPAAVSAHLRDGENDRTGVWLDVGKVMNLARLRLNGHDLGVLWTPPWRLDIRSALKPEGNILEISVANLWRNRLVGDEHLPPDAEFAAGGNILRWPDWLVKGALRPPTGRSSFASWRHFNKESPLLPSGLIGPVCILLADQ
jgi:hypothetical protein